MKTKAILYLLGVVTVILIGIAYTIETYIPQVTVTTIRSQPLADFFDSSVMVQISDLHFTHIGWRERQMIDRIKAIQPALILMTGDYVNSGVDFDQLRVCFRRLRKTAPMIAIFGNNDDYCRDSLRRIFEETDITLLENETVRLSTAADTLYIVGTGDNTRWRDNYYSAAGALHREDRRIVLAHAPAIAEMIDSSGVELILSGHIHGGQVVLPLIGELYSNRTPYVSRVYREGQYSVNGMLLYANRGIGTSVVPVRFLARPEIAVFSFGKPESQPGLRGITE